MTTQRIHPMKAQLQAAGISQADLATRAGIAATRVADLLNGRLPLTELTEKRLQTAFDALVQQRMKALTKMVAA